MSLVLVVIVASAPLAISTAIAAVRFWAAAWVGMLSALIGASSTLLLGGTASIAFTAYVWQRVKAVKQYRAP